VVDIPDACANDQDVEFDAGMLKLRGIDPKLAEYFRHAPRFTAGRHVVTLAVNGRSMGRTEARFGEHGALCVDGSLLDAAEVTVPKAPPAAANLPADMPCVALDALLPEATMELDSAKGSVSLLVPTDALRARRTDTSNYAHGGGAALFNYEVTGLNSRWSSRGSRYWSANTETGFNAGDWIVRSRQVTTSSDGRHRTDVLDTFAQRAFPGRRAVLQLGEINIMNPALPGAQITGVQLMSEQGLAVPGGATVEGVAQTQARVDVRQDGVIVYSTIVPAGPFALRDIPRINRRADLEVTVIGTDTVAQRFTVPAAMASAVAPPAGYSLAAGRTRNAGGTEAAWVISGGWSGVLHRAMNVSAGTTLASRYQAVGTGLGRGTSSGGRAQFDVTVSHATREEAIGAQVALTVSQRLDDTWSLALAHTRQTPGFRELLDSARIQAGQAARARHRDQTSASLSWSVPRLGSLSAGLSHARLFDGRTTRRALASWGTRIDRASLSLSAEWNLGQARRRGDNNVYFNLSVPLGEATRLASTVRRYAGEMRYGADVSTQVNEFASYRAGVEYRPGDRRRSTTMAFSLLPRYAQLDAAYTQDARSRTASVGLRGGVVWHAQGVTASPYAVRDTFGVLSVGDAAGVRIATPAGPVWTDARGYAVLPQLTPYGKSRIEVVTDSLPRNMDIRNGAVEIIAGRGAVTKHDFGVSRTRRVLVHARMPDGVAIPFGASVTDEQGEVVGVVQQDGEIFVPNALATPRLWIRAPERDACELAVDTGEPPEQEAYYESMTAVCRIVEGPSP
jgi:outer membrane usher protein FimD/PapC